MANFARIINNVAVDVSTDPANCFHPSIAAEFVPVPDTVQVGSRLIDGEWVDPEPAPVPEPAPEPVNPDRRITRLAFLNRFTLAERIAIRAAAESNPVVADLMALIDAATFIDLAAEQTEQSLAYLASQSLITADRAEAIISGAVQGIERPVIA